MMTVLAIAAAVVVLSALCSMSEAAFLTLPLVRARALAKLGGRTSRAVLRIRERVQYAISAIVILNTVVNLVGMSLIIAAAARVTGGSDLATAILTWITAFVTAVVVLLGEIIPKTIGERFHVGVCMAAAYPVLALIGLFHPVVWATEKIVDASFPQRRRAVTSAEEISALAEQAHKEGVIRSSEALVIQRVFRLNDITAEDVMTPRIRMKMLLADATLGEVREDLARVGFARIPIYAGTRDNVTGVVRRSEALLGLADGRLETRLSELATKAKFVPATLAVDRLLLEFQKERVQLGVVVGEYGETVGLVTLEDILEELVGEILDEKDLDEHSIKRVSREEILVHGQTEIARINHFFNTELPEDRPTIAGLILDRTGRLPRPGEHIAAEGVDIVVDEVNEKAIVRVRILKSIPREAPGNPT
jgi:CBS domain containing-hemolysin-like protein